MRQAWRSFLWAIRPQGCRPSRPSIARSVAAKPPGLTFHKRKIVWKGRQGRQYDSEKGAERCRM